MAKSKTLSQFVSNTGPLSDGVINTSDVSGLDTAYQPTLVSGTNIKTINSTSILGSGNIQIDGGVTSFNTRTGAITLSSTDVTTALGYTPYNPTTNLTIGSTGSSYTPSGTNSTLQMRGSTSNHLINVQDGSGRINHLWNASGGAGTYLVASEPAARVLITTSTAGTGNKWTYSSAPAGNAGDTITWTQYANIDPGTEVSLSARGTSTDFRIDNAGAVTIGTTLLVQGTNSRLPSHFYHYEYDAAGNIYEHYYAPGSENVKNSTANLRVSATSGTYKVLTFSGDGTFQWNGNTVLHAGNYSSYALPLTGGTVEGTANIKTSVIKQYQYVRHIEGKNWDTYDTSASGLYLNYSSNQPVYIGSGVNTALHAGNYTSYAVGITNNSSLNTDTRNTRGVTRLYRRDDNSDYSVQTYWTGTYWRLYGYNGDSGHADTQVGYSDNAGSLGGIGSSRAMLKRRTRINSSDGTSLNSSISAPEMGFTYGGSGEPVGPYISFGGLGGDIDYSCQLVGAYSSGGNDFKIRTRNDDISTWNAWRTFITDGNYTGYTAGYTGSAGALKAVTSNGYIEIGPQNSTWCHLQTDRSKFYFNKTVVADSQFSIYADETNRFVQGSLVLRSTSPTVYFRDTDHNSAMIHVNSNIFYILRGANDTESWTQVNSYWPVEINLTNNNMQCGGSFTAIGNVTAYSDIKLKENIQVIENALDKVRQIQGVTYTRNDLEDKNRRYAGVIAQHVEKVLPEVVEEDKNGVKNVAYGNMVGLLIEAIKEQDEKINRLEALIEKLLGQ